MTHKERLAYCRICQYRKMSHEGLICKLTNTKADFEKECSSFVVDEAKVQQDGDRQKVLKSIRTKHSKELRMKMLIIVLASVILGPIGLFAVGWLVFHLILFLMG